MKACSRAPAARFRPSLCMSFHPCGLNGSKLSAEASGTSNDYLAQGLFACVAAICGAGVAVEITPDWHEPLVLWQALVGSPSTGKSPAMTAAHFLLDPIEKDAGAGDPERKRALETKIEEAKISAEKWRTECAAAIKAGTPSPLKPEAAMFNVRFVPTQIVVSDATIEALADVVSGNPQGHHPVARRACGMAQQPGALCQRRYPTSRTSWKPGPQRRQRSIAARVLEPLILKKGFRSASWGVRFSLDRLAEAIEGADDGMAARFLYSWPDPAAHTSRSSERRALRRRPRASRACSELPTLRATADAASACSLSATRCLNCSTVSRRASRRGTRSAKGLRRAGSARDGHGRATGGRAGAAGVVGTRRCAIASHAARRIRCGTPPSFGTNTFGRTPSRPSTVLADRTRTARQKARRPMAEGVQGSPSCRCSTCGRKALSEGPDEDGTRRIIEWLCRGSILRARPAEVGKQGGRPAHRWEVNPALREKRV